MGLLNPGGPIAQSQRNRRSIWPVEVISPGGVRIDRYQSVYLNEIVKHFNSSLTVTIDKRCQLVTAYFKACMDKGMTKKEIDQHSYLRYLVYAITGRLIK